MSYNPTNWSDGDLVTSAKLNKIEQGITNIQGIKVVQATTIVDENTNYYTMTCTITPNELKEAFNNLQPVFVFDIQDNTIGIIISYYEDYSEYSCHMQWFGSSNNISELISNDPNEFFIETDDPNINPPTE